MRALAIFLLVVVCLLAISLLLYLKIYLRARNNNVPISYAEIISLKLNDYPPGFIIDAYIILRESDPDITIEKVKAAYKSAPKEFVNAGLQRKMREYEK